jgi:hypothetical protein
MLVVVAGLALGAGTGVAEASGSVECGQAVTEDTVLEHDLHCAGSGLEMTTGDVTLDLSGHSIQGSGSGTGILVRPCDQSGELLIRNGTVTGFDVGVHVAADQDCSHTVATTIEDLLIARNRTGVFGGIDSGSVGPTLLRSNTIRANAENGIATAFIRPFHVVGNEIVRNGGDGVVAFEDSIDRFEGNDVSRNGGDGAEFDDSVSVFLGNRFTRNAGIGLTIEERVCEFKPFYEISGNIAKHNGGGGMIAEFEFCEDPTEPPPGGGNVAKHNANFQCILIRCTTTPQAPGRRSAVDALHVSAP